MFSKYLNREIEIPGKEILSGGENVSIVPHDVLEGLIYDSPESAQENFQVHTSPVVTEPGHYAFLCIINDKRGRRVEGIGESLPATLETTIAQNYPVLMAAKRAFDDAAIKFLLLEGKTYSDQQISKPSGEADKNSDTGRTRRSTKKADERPAAPATDVADAACEQPGTAENDSLSTDDTQQDAAPKSAPEPDTANVDTSAKQAETLPAPDEFDNIIVNSGNVKNLNLSIRACYKEHPNSVKWVANDMPAQSPERKTLKDACKRFMERVEAGLEG